jgi:hypothetical protein
MKDDPDVIHRLVRRLYEKRQEAKQAKVAYRQLAEKLGRCERTTEVGEENVECYNEFRFPHDQWCDICKQKLPVWKDYHAKTNAASGALRSLLRAARSLPPVLPQEEAA